MSPLMLLMGLGSIAGTVAGASATSEANRDNRNIGLLNYYQNVDRDNRAQRETRTQRRDAQQGVTDAAGNRVRFVDGLGWVTELTPTQKDIQRGTEREQLRQVTTEADRNEKASARAAKRRGREDTLATEAERELRAVRRPDKGALRQLFLARGAEERNKSADRAGEAVARQSVRAGGTNNSQLLQGARAASDASSARQAGVDAELAARDTAAREFASERDAATKLYDYFRRASTAGTAAPQGYMPQGPQRPSTAMADQAMINILGRDGPQMPYVQPDLAWPGAISEISTNLGSMLQMSHNMKRDNALLEAFGRNLGNAGGTI